MINSTFDYTFITVSVMYYGLYIELCNGFVVINLKRMMTGSGCLFLKIGIFNKKEKEGLTVFCPTLSSLWSVELAEVPEC